MVPPDSYATGTPNTSIFTIKKEDHTLGNLLRAHLLKTKHVTFAAYRSMLRSHLTWQMAAELTDYAVAHPLVPEFELRVQTDGSVTPKEALKICCRKLVGDLDILSREFTKEWELHKVAAERKAKENALTDIGATAGDVSQAAALGYAGDAFASSALDQY